jgi:hypothetical protein
MVLPGIRGDQRTPGGLPGSGYTNPGGPVPSVPQGTRQPNMGAGVSEPDPKKIEEMFTQYTSGQITREDLFEYLHGESEGRGGILGLLEGMQEQGMGQPNTGTQPNQAKHTIPGTGVPGGAVVQGGLTSPGAAGVSIPSIKEPLDKRHQQISTLLQGYGLGPADADQMSTVLNPHTEFHTREYSDDEGLWMDMYADDPALTAAGKDQPESGSIAWDPTVRTAEGGKTTGEALPTYDINPATGEPYVADQGSAAAEMSAQAGLGLETGTTGGGYVRRYVPETGQTTTKAIGDIKGAGVTAADASRLDSDSSLSFAGQYTAWTPADIAAADQASKQKVATSVMPTAGPDMSWEPTDDAPVKKHGDAHPDGSGWTWDANTKKYVAPEVKRDPVEKFKGNVHAAFEGMPKGYGGISGTLLGSIAAGYAAGAGAAPGWDKDLYEDPFGFSWPSREAYNQFTSDMNDAWGKSHTMDGLPVIWTSDGPQHPKFQGWVDGKPTFGLPGQVGKDSFFGVELDDGNILYFDTRAGADSFGTGPNSGKLPGGGTYKDGKLKDVPDIVPPDPNIVPADGTSPLPDGYKWGTDQVGNPIVIKIADGSVVTETDNKGNIVIPSPEDAKEPSVTPSDTEIGTGPIITDPRSLAQGASYGFGMFDDFVKQLDTSTMLADDKFAGVMATVIKDLEVVSEQGDQASRQRMTDEIVNQLDRAAVTLRAELDRKLQQGVAMGKIGEDATLAAKIEANKAVLEASKISGKTPIMGNDGNLTTGSEEGVVARQVTMSETEKTNQRKQNLTQLFGQWMPGDPTTNMQTLERDKFGLTKAIAAAEISGKIPKGLPGEGSQTLSAKRMAWEQDVARQSANTQQQEAQNRAKSILVDQQIANNKRILDDRIQTGHLAEAVEARKDATFLAKQKLDIEREKMKLDTLTALSNPATYLFAVRYGLLEQIGGVLGISWGDDAITSAELPSMVEPGTFPSLTDFQNATPTEREIMLAEVASSGGFTTDEAVRMIMEGAPGGRDIRRTSLVGVSR